MNGGVNESISVVFTMFHSNFRGRTKPLHIVVYFSAFIVGQEIGDFESGIGRESQANPEQARRSHSAAAEGQKDQRGDPRRLPG